MNVDLQSDRNEFNAFVDNLLASVRKDVSLEDALNEFRAYQRELFDARSKISAAKASSKRGESGELDIEQVILEVTNELAEEGIRD
jgi:hypothetical protein